MDYGKYYEKSNKLRKRFIEIFSKRGFGHLTTAFSEVEILVALFEGMLRFDDNKKLIDRFFISKGHGAGMIFPVLEDMGILSKEDIDNIVCDGGDITAIREYALPGFEFYGGSLGIGLGMAAGLALGVRLNREDRFIYALLGDAECYEGSIYEAMVFAGHNELNNLVVIVDRNSLGVSDFTENMCRLEPFDEKWKSCGWEVKRINGHSYEELFDALSDVRLKKRNKPLCVIADTVKGKGIDYLSNIPLKHGYMPVGAEAERAIEALSTSGR